MQNDLISRSKLLEKSTTAGLYDALGNEYPPRNIVFAEDVIDAPAVDAVPVVRCGECINYGYRNRHWDDICLKNEPKGCRKWLDKMGMFIIDNPNDFCSYGERKEPTNGIE